MGYNRLEISGVTIYGNVFRPKSYGVKRRIDCMLSEPSNSRFKNGWNAVFVKCARCMSETNCIPKSERLGGDELKHQQYTR